MATISGKRFQITDGASSLTNLFPYTVTEAVYGLSTVLANTQSAAVSAAATSAASLYLPLTGGTMTGNLTMGANAVVFNSNSSSTWANPKNSGLRILNALVASIPGAPATYATGISVSGYYGFQLANTDASNTFKIRGTSDGTSGSERDWVTLYHSGNSNKSDVAWTCSPLNITTPSGSSNSPYIYTEDKGNPAALIYLNSTGFTYNSRVNNAWVRQFTIDSSTGNVGIGTPSPGFKLDVAGGTRATIYYFTDLTSSIGYIGKAASSNNHIYLGSYNNGHVLLMPNGTGNVGLGTASPEAKFDVYGGASRFVNGGKAIIMTGQGSPWYGTKIYMTYDSGSTYTSCRIGASYTYRAFSIGFANFSSSVAQTPANMDGLTYTDVFSVTPAGVLATSGDQVISSDAALKKNWREVGYGIEEIANCTVGRFDWKDGHGTSVGSKAQDWLPLVPELVHGEEGNMTLAYGQIALVNSILLAKHETEQDKEIARLKARVKELETRLNVS